MTLLAGVARREITPPPGMTLIGYGNRFLPNIGAKDPLYATALVLQDRGTKFMLISVDLLAVSDETVARVESAVGYPVVICCSHTHAGPIAHADAKTLPHYRWFMTWLVRQISDAVAQAERRLQPVTVQVGQLNGRITVNRRQRNPDGSVSIGVNPHGLIDDSVQTLRFVYEDGEPLAHVVNYACHATSLGPGNIRASADWVGAMRHTVERETGVPCLFIQGACADLNPRNQHRVRTQWADRLTLGRSVAESVFTSFETLHPIESTPLKLKTDLVQLPLEPTDKLADPRKRLSDFVGIAVQYVDPLLKLLFPWSARIQTDERGQQSVTMRVDVVQLGDLLLVGLGAEVFTEIGLQIKEERSNVMVAGVTNGCIGYLPTPEEHDLGGYEIDISPYFFRLPSRLQRNASISVIETVKQTISHLHSSD